MVERFHCQKCDAIVRSSDYESYSDFKLLNKVHLCEECARQMVTAKVNKNE